jgi:hypothetical protein
MSPFITATELKKFDTLMEPLLNAGKDLDPKEI